MPYLNDKAAAAAEEFINTKETPKAFSIEPTPYAVYCDHNGDRELIYMTREFYIAQLQARNCRWICPVCFEEASFSDLNYEEWRG